MSLSQRIMKMKPPSGSEKTNPIQTQFQSPGNEPKKLKKAPQMPRPAGGFADMSEEERTKFIEQMRKVRQEQQKVFQTILAQVYRLQGRRPPEEEGVQYVIINTTDLKSMQESATKEKATETGRLIERLIARASGRGGFRGGRTGSGQRRQR